MLALEMGLMLGVDMVLVAVVVVALAVARAEAGIVVVSGAAGVKAVVGAAVPSRVGEGAEGSLAAGLEVPAAHVSRRWCAVVLGSWVLVCSCAMATGTCASASPPPVVLLLVVVWW